MLKRLILALAFVGLLSPAYSAGTVPGFSLTPQFDLTGKVAPGCKLYVIQSGTVSTPQIAYQDSGLTIPVPGGSTLTCDAAGRLPQWFVADGNIKLRLTTSTGSQIFVQDGLLVVGSSSGGGGGGTVDPTTILQTGDIKSRYGTGILTGFVRMNARTIGSATSGATERANSDVQALFEYLWSDPSLTVSTGRGASANADWVANKTITLPDGRGRVLAGLDDMGNSAAGRLTGAYFGACTGGANGLSLGNVGGCESWTLVNNHLPTTQLSFSGTTQSWGSSTADYWRLGSVGSFLFGGGGTGVIAYNNGSGVTQGNVTTSVTPSGTISAFGGGLPHPIVQPTILVTNYMKL